MSDNFLHLGLQELSELVQKAEKALAEKKKSERKNVIAQIKELADSIGVSVTIHEGSFLQKR
jgi:DNA-binding protein H-NS